MSQKQQPTVDHQLLESEPRIVQLDLERPTEIPKIVAEAIKIFGRIDILINNAGISYRGEVCSTALEVDMKVMMVNYFGQVAVTKG